MRASFKVSLVAIGFFLLVPSLYGQASMQHWCALQVAKDMEATQRDTPAVYATISIYMFEWSKSRQACVMIIHYRAQKDGIAMIQILAMNAVTTQPMEGYKNVFLVPQKDEKGIEDSTNFLFKKYSH